MVKATLNPVAVELHGIDFTMKITRKAKENYALNHQVTYCRVF